MIASPPPLIPARVRYPSTGLQQLVVKELAALNNFNAEDVYKKLAVGTDPGSVQCCLVHQRPHRRMHKPRSPLYYGHEGPGYTLVSPRDAELCTPWPTLPTTCRPAPVRLHRWLLQASEHCEVLHACDDPRCIRVAHLATGTHAQNLRAAHDRGCRSKRPLLPTTPTTRLQVPTPLPTPTFDARDATFCVVGWHSPTKKARWAAATAPPPFPSLD